MASIELDVSEQNAFRFVEGVERKGLSWTRLADHGPAGKPVYRVTGAIEQITWLVCEYLRTNRDGVNPDELRHLLDHIRGN